MYRRVCTLAAVAWFVASTSVLAEENHQLVSVRSFGAKGDGKSDDTAALQKAIDAGAGSLRFPSGTYRISKPLVVDLDKTGYTAFSSDGTAQLVMTGPGPAIWLKGTHGGTADPKTVKPNVWQNQRMPTVDGLAISGEHPRADGIRAEGTMAATFSRLHIRKVNNAIHLTGRNRNVLIAECHLYENAGVGIWMDKLNLHQINISNCHISYNDAGGIVVTESEIRNLQIGTCDIESNMGTNHPPTANILIDCRNGSVREGAIVGCTIQHNHEAADSANIRFLGQSQEQPQKVGHFAIADNALSDVFINVHLIHARGVTITGNTMWKGFAHNLLADDCSQIVVGPNLFDRNPDYKPIDSPDGLLFTNCSDSTLTGLHIKHTISVPAGLILRNCRRFNVTGCTILECENAGILLDNVRDSIVANCLVSNDKDPHAAVIQVINSDRNQIVNNLTGGAKE